MLLRISVKYLSLYYSLKFKYVSMFFFLHFNIFLMCVGVPKFVLITVHDYNLPPFVLSSGYFTGKRSAEAELLSKYPNSGKKIDPAHLLDFGLVIKHYSYQKLNHISL